MAADGRATDADGNDGDDELAATRRSLRDMGALLTLPALWVDHEPREIATVLISVLVGVLRLDSAYVRFDDPDGGEPVETWRPAGSRPPEELVSSISGASIAARGIATTGRSGPSEPHSPRVATVSFALPWETGLVTLSAPRSSFPTAAETRLLRVAISQGAIAVHTARRVAREHAARVSAEAMLERQDRLLRNLADDVGESLESILRRIREGGVELDVGPDRPEPRDEPMAPHPAGRSLTRREQEVLGLLAQGLSNKEIAGVMWLSDRTVERHITSIYRKIGVARRSEATAFALRNGVV